MKKFSRMASALIFTLQAFLSTPIAVMASDMPSTKETTEQIQKATDTTEKLKAVSSLQRRLRQKNLIVAVQVVKHLQNPLVTGRNLRILRPRVIKKRRKMRN